MMRKLLLGVLLGCCCMVIAACGQQKGYQYYVTHPGKIGRLYNRCLNQQGADDAMATQCVDVIKAATKIRSLFMLMASNNKLFGQQLMAEQVKLADLHEKLNDARQSGQVQAVARATHAFNQQQLEVDARLAVIRMVWDQMQR